MPSSPSLWFRFVGLIAAIFILTVFVMIAGVFSDPNLPVNVWLNRHGTPLLLGEVGLLLALGSVAMLSDRQISKDGSGPRDQRKEITDDDATTEPSSLISDP